MLLFVNNLTNSDFCFLHPQRGLLGETWLSHIELEGELDEQGMICDFGIVKSTVRSLLDDLIDHRLLIPSRSSQLTENIADGDNWAITWQLDNGDTVIHRSPREAITLIDAEGITPDTVARWCEARLREQLPDSIHAIRISFTTEIIDGAQYHYSHGLKKHRGKCQRIAHGHRSKIIIHRNGERDEKLEQYWANQFRDIFIGTSEDLLSADNENAYRFAYQSPEGHFQLELPKALCYLIDADSTVENIAAHVARETKKQCPDDNIQVRAFEGLAKGAVVKQ